MLTFKQLEKCASTACRAEKQMVEIKAERRKLEQQIEALDKEYKRLSDIHFTALDMEHGVIPFDNKKLRLRI
jgi:cell division protein FtsB